MEIKQADVVLCAFYFRDMQQTKNRPVLVLKDNLPYDDFIDGTIPVSSKLMMRKAFVVSKKAILKKYGTISAASYEKYHQSFCQYFNCTGTI